MLTGRPEEEMPASAGDLLQDLSQLHEQARQVMRGVAKALWPSGSPPGNMEELVSYLTEHGGGSDYARYRLVGKVRERPGPW